MEEPNLGFQLVNGLLDAGYLIRLALIVSLHCMYATYICYISIRGTSTVIHFYAPHEFACVRRDT